MSYTNIHVKRRPPLAVVTIDRPKVLNALNSETISELDAAFAGLLLPILLSLGGDSSLKSQRNGSRVAGPDSVF